MNDSIHVNTLIPEAITIQTSSRRKTTEMWRSQQVEKNNVKSETLFNIIHVCMSLASVYVISNISAYMYILWDNNLSCVISSKAIDVVPVSSLFCWLKVYRWYSTKVHYRGSATQIKGYCTSQASQASDQKETLTAHEFTVCIPKGYVADSSDWFKVSLRHRPLCLRDSPAAGWGNFQHWPRSCDTRANCAPQLQN